MTSLLRRIGFEVELLAPRGASRLDLARALAKQCGGEVLPVWHHDSEPAPVQHLGGRFLTLTRGFEVRRATGELLCTLVDDVTITADLDLTAPAPPGCHRLLTDDIRLAGLLASVCSPAADLNCVLDPLGELWHEVPERVGSVWRLDAGGATVALAAPAGSERERPCEIVTPPIDEDHAEALEQLLAAARDLSFVVPREAAVHLHVDGGPFRDPTALANVIRLFAFYRNELRTRLGTNPHCKRLAPLPDELIAAAVSSASYDELQATAQRSHLTKFHDVNLTQLLCANPIRDTLEIRILPGAMDSAPIIERALVIDALLDRCLDPTPVTRCDRSLADAIQQFQ